MGGMCLVKVYLAEDVHMCVYHAVVEWVKGIL